MSFFDFAVDIVCMMPPLGEIDAITLTRNQAILISLGSIGLLVLAITISVFKEIFPKNTAVAVIAALCVVSIGLIGLDQETLKSIFLCLYPPMVITLRFAEGAIGGDKTARYLRWWHTILFVAVIAGLYYLLKPLHNESLVFVKSIWALLGTGTAAFMWTRIMTDCPHLNNPLCIFSVFMVFASTLTYVTASPLESLFYQWVFPIGLIIGIIYGRLSAKNANPP